MSTLVERLRAQAQVDYEEVLLHYRLRQVLILGDLPEPYYRDWDEYVPQSQEALAVKAIAQELGGASNATTLSLAAFGSQYAASIWTAQRTLFGCRTQSTLSCTKC